MSKTPVSTSLQSSTARRLFRYAPFLTWALWFYFAWVILIILTDTIAVVLQHWRIALVMIAGSYFAGSTPVGGGSIAFPILVLFFGESPTVGRGFAFAIQALGMTSAAIFIFCRRKPLAWGPFWYALVTSTFTTPLTLVYLAPHVSETTMKITFACIWGSFGILVFHRLSELLASNCTPKRSAIVDPAAGIIIGLLGGLSAGLTGVGTDMIAFTTLVLLYRADMRIAIPTALLLMAWNSLLGTLVSASLGMLGSAEFHNWLAAAPIVIIGAPLGALCVHFVPRKLTLLLISAICIMQLIYVLYRVAGPSPTGLDWKLFAVVGTVILAFNLLFQLLHTLGKRLNP